MSGKPPPGPCRNCDHQVPHNLWGRCSEPGCECRSADFPAADQPGPTEKKARKTAAKKQPEQGPKVLVFRNPHNERPVAVPDEIVSEADRVYRAYQLHRRGMSWEQIARHDQWPTATAVAAEVKRYLDEGKSIIGDLVRREMLSVEYDTLRALQDALWDAAMEGKLQAVMGVRTLVMDRVKVYDAMYGVVDPNAGDGGTPRTVVVLSGSEEDYVNGLKAVVGDEPARQLPAAPDDGGSSPPDG